MTEFKKRKNDAFNVTKEFVRQKFEKEFKKTGNKILLEERIEEAAQRYLSSIFPAYMRTREAVAKDLKIPLAMEAELNRFILNLDAISEKILNSEEEVQFYCEYQNSDQCLSVGKTQMYKGDVFKDQEIQQTNDFKLTFLAKKNIQKPKNSLSN